MIILKSLRQQCALLARSSPQIKPFKTQTTRWYSGHSLKYDDYFRRHGVPDVLSKEGFDRAWTQYQAYLIFKLNQMTAGSPDSSSSMLNLVYKYAREADKASLFNHASMAHNNALFFSSLCPGTTEIPEVLASYITGSFSSIDSLRETFIATAAAMFGPGFVWLVKQNSGPTLAVQNLAILTTYIAGSPYPRAHFRKQSRDMNTESTNITNRMSAADVAAAGQHAGSFGLNSANAPDLAPGGVELEVLLGVSTWEHVWILDHGVDGKRRYLEAFWNRIDWDVVNKRAVWNKRSGQTQYSRPIQSY